MTGLTNAFTSSACMSRRCARCVTGRSMVNVGLAMAFVIISLSISGCRAFQNEQLTQLQRARRAAEIFGYTAPATVKVKPVKAHMAFDRVTKLFSGLPPLSPRTQLLLRRYDVQERTKSDPYAVIQWLQELVKQSPQIEEVNALAEIAKRQADWHQLNGDTAQANKMDATALLHAHQFLFDSDLDIKRNAYDPQFRQICDIYNGSLESITRRLCTDGSITHGKIISIGDGDLGFDMQIQFEGRWRDQTFERFELVSDYQTEGIDNHFHTYGLGVPLIAVVEKSGQARGVEKYYPPSLTLPMTAFCEIQPQSSAPVQPLAGSQRRTAILRLYDPLENTTTESLNRVVPLESDITTPLAYHLKDPLLNNRVLATATLLDSSLADKIHGLYMLEPFDPTKIPVVMVHGLWSSPVTWAQMFNDLRALPEIHSNYQFWFYSYATSQPFVISAGEMRRDLTNIRRELDPGNDSIALEQMVLVGHSMGGLISRMQTINSRNDIWNLVGEGDFNNLQGDPAAIERLRETVFFNANPSVKRVITIATPHHGSRTSTPTTRWLSGKIISLPQSNIQDFETLAQNNLGIIHNPKVLTGTSVDSLSPEAPVLTALDMILPQPQTIFHNVIGRVEKNNRLSRLAGKSPGLGSDGVISVTNAQYEHSKTQTIVPSPHTDVHMHPKCILEVRHILLRHLVDQNRIRARAIPQIPFVSPVVR